MCKYDDMVLCLVHCTSPSGSLLHIAPDYEIETSRRHVGVELKRKLGRSARRRCDLGRAAWYLLKITGVQYRCSVTCWEGCVDTAW